MGHNAKNAEYSMVKGSFGGIFRAILFNYIMLFHFLYFLQTECLVVSPGVLSHHES